MTVSGSSTSLSITARKTNATKTANGIAEVRLTSGNVEQSAPVQWTAAVPREDAAWLSVNVLSGPARQVQVNGEVYGRSPASQFQVNVDTSGLNDTRGAALYSSSIAIRSTIASSLANGTMTFVNGSDQLPLPVSVTVIAAAYVTEADVTVSSKANREPVSPSGVPAGTSLVVTVQTRDCDRLVIDRPDQQLKLVLTSTLGGYTPRYVTLLYKECSQCAGLFEAELPGTALDNPGLYELRIRSDDSAATCSLTTFDPSGAQLAQGAVLGAAAACILAGMLFLIYRNPERAKQLLLSFITNEFKMLLATVSDVWDIVGMHFCLTHRSITVSPLSHAAPQRFRESLRPGDLLVFSTFLAASQDENDRSRLQDLTVPYWVCIALAMLISLISLGYRVFEWWAQVRTRVRTARHMGIETQPTRREALLAKIAVAKQTCIAHILAFSVAVIEDIPMGTLTVMFTVRMYELPIAVVLSLVTTCIMLGMKLNKLTLLKYWYAGGAFAPPEAMLPVQLVYYPTGGTRSAHGRQSSRTARWQMQRLHLLSSMSRTPVSRRV
jgi:hypothetical protein